MLISTELKLIPELRGNEAGFERPQTALLGFKPDMVETVEFGRTIQSELAEKGILYDPDPEEVPSIYINDSGTPLLTPREITQLVAQKEKDGASLAGNVLKGMSWARLESEVPGPIDVEKAQAIGEAVGAVYNAQYGLWDGNHDNYKSKKPITLSSYMDGHARFFVRGSDAGLIRDAPMIDARTNRLADLVSEPQLPQDRAEEIRSNTGISERMAEVAHRLGSRMTSMAGALHL
jgi:hypothetical protein